VPTSQIADKYSPCVTSLRHESGNFTQVAETRRSSISQDDENVQVAERKNHHPKISEFSIGFKNWDCNETAGKNIQTKAVVLDASLRYFHCSP
jgi:hypothetical protein